MESVNPNDNDTPPDPHQHYQDSVLDLKAEAILTLDSIKNLRPGNKREKRQSLQRVQKLINMLQALCRDHLGSPKNAENPLVLKLSTEQHHNCYLENVIGGNEEEAELTLVSLKSENEFAVATDNKGLLLISQDTPLYSAVFPEEAEDLLDLVYIRPLDSYLIGFEDKLFIKYIDDNPPELYMEQNCRGRPGACFRYSESRGRLLVNNGKGISVVNLNDREEDDEFMNSAGGEIQDFRVVGKEGNRVVAVTEDNYLVLFDIADYDSNEDQVGGMVDHHKIETIKGRDEQGLSIAICDKNEHILVEVEGFNKGHVCSRMFVFKLVGDLLEKTAVLDLLSLKVGHKYALDFFQCLENHILWVGLTNNHNGYALVYDYNTESRELRELHGLRTFHEEIFPVELHRLNGDLYYIGCFGRLMRLTSGFGFLD